MHIYVKVLKGSECEIAVSPGVTVLEVKKLLQDQVSIPVEQQKLIFQGKQLADDKDLSHYKVGDGAKLFLMLKKPGSGVTPSTSSTPSSSKSVPQTPTTFPRTTEQEVPPFTIEHDPTGFWEKLTTFLKRHFTEKDALKVLQVFKKDFDNGMCNMSLDDIERLAAARLRLTQGYSHEKKIR